MNETASERVTHLSDYNHDRHQLTSTVSVAPLLIAIGGEKGGQGKSHVARALAEYLIEEKGKRPALIDTDVTSPVLKTHFNSAESVDLTNTAKMEGDRLIELALERGLALVDLRAASTVPLHKWMLEGFREVAIQAGLNTVMFHLVDNDPHACAALQASLNQLRDVATVKSASGTRHLIRHVIVLNLARAENFDTFDRSDVAKMVKDLNCPIMRVPALHAEVATKINDRKLTFSGAAKHPAFPVMQRIRISNHLHHQYYEEKPDEHFGIWDEFDRVFKLLEVTGRLL